MIIRCNYSCHNRHSLGIYHKWRLWEVDNKLWLSVSCRSSRKLWRRQRQGFRFWTFGCPQRWSTWFAASWENQSRHSPGSHHSPNLIACNPALLSAHPKSLGRRRSRKVNWLRRWPCWRILRPNIWRRPGLSAGLTHLVLLPKVRSLNSLSACVAWNRISHLRLPFLPWDPT